MHRTSVYTHFVVVTLIAIATTCSVAKDPRSERRASVLPAIESVVGSLTPPPKEWAMFPQDEPTPLPQQAPAKNGQNPAQPNAPANVATGGTVESQGVVSATNARPIPQREFPLIWMLLTAGLSLGALAASGSLILRKDALSESDDIPVVSELQEVNA
ncbi:MAG: hypothetical protein WCT04_11030 [Planctomycetota bacterium]